VTAVRARAPAPSYQPPTRPPQRATHNSHVLLYCIATNLVTPNPTGYKSVISFRGDGEPTTRLPADPATGAVANWEFSDDSGNWDLEAERAAFSGSGLRYYNAPVTGAGAFTVGQLEQYVPIFEEAAKAGATLVHCTSGYRSSVYTLAFKGRLEGRCADWAFEQAAIIGYNFTVRPADAKVRQFFKDALSC
jgi:protein tyrosine phosphatase (PTP) superfamily phosphohydrolase (DUF442 family)